MKKISSIMLVLLFSFSFLFYCEIVFGNNYEETIDFGTVVKGNTSSKRFSLKSLDSSKVNIECVASTSYHWITINPDHFILEPGEIIHIEVSVSTNSLRSGKYVGEFFIYTTGTPSQFSYKAIVDVIEKIPKLKVDEQPIDIITMKKNDSITKSILIENIGGDVLFANFTCNEAWVDLNPKELKIFANQSAFLSIEISLDNLDKGFYSSKVNIQSNGGNASIPISLRIQEETPYLYINPSVIELGEIYCPPKTGTLIKVIYW